MFDVVLPAGGTLPSEFAAQVGTQNKALIQIGGRTILDRVFDAIEESGLARRTVLVGAPGVLESPQAQRADVCLDQGTSAPDNILIGLRWLAEHDPAPTFLVVTTDLPFISGATLRRYVEACPEDADLTLPLISKAQWDDRFPGTGATFARLGDGEWTAGCAYRMRSAAFRSALPHIEAVFQNRKSVLGMARLLGPAFLFRFITRRLTVPDLERKIQTMLGCQAVAVRDSPPELAYDIDDDTDLAYARQHAG